MYKDTVRNVQMYELTTSLSTSIIPISKTDFVSNASKHNCKCTSSTRCTSSTKCNQLSRVKQNCFHIYHLTAHIKLYSNFDYHHGNKFWLPLICCLQVDGFKVTNKKFMVADKGDHLLQL